MKTRFVAVLVCLALVGGCGLKITVPPGCEQAILYKVPGFAVIGPAVIRTGMVTLTALVPASKPVVLIAVQTGYEAVKQGKVLMAIKTMLTVISPWVDKFPLVKSLLDKLEAYATDTNATQCDRDWLAALFVNIAKDLGAPLY